uniref:G protein-coupled receptor kinase interacting ArfGAP 2b n=1 Tax=Astyanax mexicanus TaxID=7994 RepID=A0A8B9JWG6_ASTMX
MHKKKHRKKLCKRPRWASINRGVLICDECCSIHRGLGRHSSQVRHLTHTAWPPSQLQMVQTLYSNGANSIWEHSLLDPSSIMSGKRKANPQDRVHPNKTEFIKAKYQMLAFVHRMPCREDDSVTAKDLSKQLHSSVRTGNLETCLRLLSLGAQANFFHPEKGNTPLHVAAKAGQQLQAELLTVYGADPGAPDSSGNTPIDYARQAGHQDLADRLVEIQYELTDRLAFYLCGRRPDHKNGQHFIIPQIADRPGHRTAGWSGEGVIPELGDPDECEPDPTLPSTEDVISKTEQITKNIQELLRAAQENKHESFVPCSERIHQAVTEMATLFPKRPSSEMVRGSLRLLTSSASRLQGECNRATPADSCPADAQLVTQQLIQCAYDIAKAAKQLVTVTTKESN